MRFDSLAFCLSMLSLATVAAQSRPTRPASWMPVAVGASWEYRTATGETVVVDCTTQYETNANGITWLQLLSSPAGKAWEQWSMDADGIYVRRQTPGTARGRAWDLETEVRVLSLPVGIAASWRDPEAGCSAELERVGERIETPAGTFETARVVVRGSSSAGELVSTLWFARGVGIVKRTDGKGREAVTLVLTRFVAANAPVDADLAAAVHASPAVDPELLELGPPGAFLQLRDAALRRHFPNSRFCVVAWPNATVLLREHRGAVRRIDPASHDDWSRLLADERVRLEGSTRDRFTGTVEVESRASVVAYQVLTQILRLASVAKGGSLGDRVAISGSYGNTSEGAGATAEAELDGKRWKFELLATPEGMRVVSVK